MRKHLTKLVIGAFLIMMGMPVAQGQEQFKRNLEQNKFIPKGQWITGISVNYQQSNQNNYQFFILEKLSGDSYQFKVSPMALYAFKDNLAAGGKFNYSRMKTHLDKASLVLDSETNYDGDNLYQISSNYSVTGAFRNYFSLGSSRRFGIFNEVQLELGGGRSKLTDGRDQDVSGTFDKNFNLSVGLSPGLVMFLNNYSAIEVNVGLLGFGYTHTTSVKDRIYKSHRHSKHANFKINLFSISFGAAFYI